MAVEVIGKGAEDGTVLGSSSSEKIGFYGVSSPVAQQSVEQQTTKTTTQLRAEVSAIQDALDALGLVAKS